MSAPNLQTYNVLGVPITVTTLVHAAETIESWAKDAVGRFVCIRDVASLMTIVDDPHLKPIHSRASMITPDGMPLVAVGRTRGLPVERTCGPDLLEFLCARSVQTGLKHYFYGGKSGVPAKLVAALCDRYPGLRVVGYESPPFRPMTPEEDASVIRRILDSGADIVWVGISSPKQEVWMFSHCDKLPQTLIGVGAAFDFASGSITRAPAWMQRSGLEWLYRLAHEPRRLWRRYLVLAPKFIYRLAIDWLKERRSKNAR